MASILTHDILIYAISVRSSVTLTNAGIVSKRMHIIIFQTFCAMVRSAAALPYGKFLVENAKSPTLCIAIFD